MEKRKIQPKQGLMVLFAGNHTLHGVNKIKKGNRYTIPCWYTKCKRKKEIKKNLAHFLLN